MVGDRFSEPGWGTNVPGLCNRVRESCVEIAATARHVRIDLDAAGAIGPGREPSLDSERHYLEGSRDDVIAYLLTLDAINFGSGWFPTLRKRPCCSGYYTVAWALADRFRERGPWSPADLGAIEAAEIARVLGQDPGHELMGLYARVAPARRLPGCARSDRRGGRLGERLAELLAESMPMFADTGFWKRAQITANDLTLAGVASSPISTGSRFSPTTSSRTCCGWTASSSTTRSGRADRLGRAVAAGAARARDPGLRRPRLRGDRLRAGHPGAHPRCDALEPRPGAALQGAPPPPHAHDPLLSRDRAWGEPGYPPTGSGPCRGRSGRTSAGPGFRRPARRPSARPRRAGRTGP